MCWSVGRSVMFPMSFSKFGESDWGWSWLCLYMCVLRVGNYESFSSHLSPIAIHFDTGRFNFKIHGWNDSFEHWNGLLLFPITATNRLPIVMTTTTTLDTIAVVEINLIKHSQLRPQLICGIELWFHIPSLLFGQYLETVFRALVLHTCSVEE